MVFFRIGIKYIYGKGGGQMDNLLKNFIIDDNFMGKYVELITKEVIPYQMKLKE